MDTDVSLTFHFSYPIETIWKALTDSTILSQWIWGNNFQPIVGKSFQFWTEPSQWWNGKVDGEVLEVDEPYILSYSWISAGESTHVAWTVKENHDNNGTIVHLKQTGFSEETKSRSEALDGAASAWTTMLKKLDQVLAQL